NSRATLFAVLDSTVTSAGRRLLYQRLINPLTDRSRIEERLAAVEELFLQRGIRQRLRSLLKNTGDLSRYLARLSTNRGTPRDLLGLKETLEIVPQIRELLSELKSPLLLTTHQRLHEENDLLDELRSALVDEPPISSKEGNIFRDGYDPEVDHLRELTRGGQEWLERLEREERLRTGIPNLKVGYNRIFGYYIEITKSHLDKIPSRYRRRQTLVGAERFTVPELEEFEERILTAAERLKEREEELYQALVNRVLSRASAIQDIAQGLAELDLQAALAEKAEVERYHRPHLYDDYRLILRGSRHPVMEALMPPGESFTPNDIEIIPEGSGIFLITGPNMAGKSTFLRQVALCVIMAQMGSFVPAEEVHIGIVDRILTRIGAMDNLAGGESTFLVEMQETASILHNASSRSLILFDEIGRGTSTFDGLALAWSIVEYLHQSFSPPPRTLFATHFHELTELEHYLPRVHNLNVAVQEYGDKVVFLHRLVPGASDRSFGIYVAQMAGIPASVVSRAKEVMSNLEGMVTGFNESSSHLTQSFKSTTSPVSSSHSQKSKGFPRSVSVQLRLFDPSE
ncbi:MAG: DNA mismatch repair protein MutS, partial [bacterium]